MAGLRQLGNATRFSVVSKRKITRAWTVYKLAKVGKQLGTVYGETEKEALANAHKQFAKTEAEKRIYHIFEGSQSAIIGKAMRMIKRSISVMMNGRTP
jgi:hypothetical protein